MKKIDSDIKGDGMRHHRQRWLALLVSAGLVATACTSGDDDEDDAGGDGGDASDEELLSWDVTDQCGTEEYQGIIGAVEAVDERTVEFTLCQPDAAFEQKVAFSTNAIYQREFLEENAGTDALFREANGTGPYRLEEWREGDQIILTRNDDYWGDAAQTQQLIFRWNEEPTARLSELQSGQVHAIDNVGTEDFETIQNDEELQLLAREPLLNVAYLGFNVDQAPFDDPLVRQAIAHAIDRERLVENFYPEGSQVANQILPPGMLGHEEGFTDFEYDPQRARDLLAQAGHEDGLEVDLSYRVTPRPYMPFVEETVTDIASQLEEVGIQATPDERDPTGFIDDLNAGNIGMHVVGWNVDFFDPANVTDYHFGVGGSPQFGTGFDDIHQILTDALVETDEDARAEMYAQFNDLLVEHVPAVPLAYGVSAVAYQAGVEDAHASPLANEYFAPMSVEEDAFVWMQQAEPGGTYCADESDGESLRLCEQIYEPLLGYEPGGLEVEPLLAEDMPESNDDGTVWTFTLRDDVTFHDGQPLHANDVVLSYQVSGDAEHELHTGREGLFSYWDSLWGAFVNAPEEEAAGG